MRDTKKILLLCNIIFVLFLLFSSYVFTYFSLNPVDNNGNTLLKSNIYLDSKSNKSIYIEKSPSNNMLKLNYFEDREKQSTSKLFCFIKRKLSNGNTRNTTRILFTKNSIRKDYFEGTIQSHYLANKTTKTEKANKNYYIAESSTINNFVNYISNDYLYDELKALEDPRSLVNPQPQKIQIPFETINSSYYSHYPFILYNINSLYNISLIIQISFAFALSGLYTNKNVLKLGVY